VVQGIKKRGKSPMTEKFITYLSMLFLASCVNIASDNSGTISGSNTENTDQEASKKIYFIAPSLKGSFVSYVDLNFRVYEANSQCEFTFKRNIDLGPKKKVQAASLQPNGLVYIHVNYQQNGLRAVSGDMRIAFPADEDKNYTLEFVDESSTYGFKGGHFYVKLWEGSPEHLIRRLDVLDWGQCQPLDEN
jgi:hypothetical protein